MGNFTAFYLENSHHLVEHDELINVKLLKLVIVHSYAENYRRPDGMNANGGRSLTQL